MQRWERLWRELLKRTDYERCERPRAARFDLSAPRQLLAALGNPQDAVPAIHIAGSKGKGSVAHYLERGLRAAGLRTGLYTSPHLETIEERIRIDGEPITRDALADSLEAALDVACKEATFFDIFTATAFHTFREVGCQVQVVEVGLGGRLDSTNVLRPLAAAVVSVELEHTDVLGDDLVTIGAEKAGIFKPGARLWSSLPQSHPAGPVLAARAASLGQRLSTLPESSPTRADLPQPQAHQQRNYALAHSILLELDEAGVMRGAAGALEHLPPSALALPGRYERRVLQDGRSAVLDVAHTPTSIADLLTVFRAETGGRRTGLLLALRADKDVAAIAAALGPRRASEARWVLPAGDHPLSAEPRSLATMLDAVPLDKLGFPEGPDIFLVAGSTYLVGALRPKTTPAATFAL